MLRFLVLIIFYVVGSYAICQTTSDSEIEAIIQTGHSKTISTSAISSDGKYIATGSIDRSIIIWDAKTGKEIRVLQHHYKSILGLHFSSDNKSLLSVSNDNSVKLTDVESGQIIHDFPPIKYDISNAMFNGDGSKVIIFDKRDQYSVWDTFTGQLIGNFKKDYSSFNDSKTVSYNGERALSKFSENTIGCISLITLDTLFTMPFKKAFTMSFSSDDKYIVVGSSRLFATVFDGQTGDSLHTVTTSTGLKCDGCKTQISISDDSKYVFSISNKGVGQYWQIKNGKRIQKITTLEKTPKSIVLSADNKFLLLSFSDQFKIYNLSSGKEILTTKNKDLKYFRVKMTDGKYALPGKENSVDLWSITNQKVVKNFKGYLNKERSDGLTFDYSVWIDVNILQFISFKSTLAVRPNSTEITLGKVDTSALVLDIKTGKQKMMLSDSKKAAFCQDYSKDGKWLAVAGGDRIIRIYDTETYQLVHIIRGHQEMIFDLQFSNDPNILLSASWDGTVRTWDINKKEMLSYIELDKTSPYTVRYSKNDLYLVTGDLSQDVIFWETDTKSKFRTLVGHSEPISDIVFSEDGQQVLTASWDGKIKLWHTLTGMQLAKFNHKGAPVYAVNFSKDQQQIISGDGDRKVKFWDIKTGELVSQLSGHISAITDIKITTDGRFMITRGAKGEVIVWDYYSKKQLYTYMQINQNDWLVTTPSGHFDGSKAALNLVNYVSGMEVVSLGSLFDKYYTPGLAKRVMKGEIMNDSGENFNSLIKNRPELAFQITRNKKRTAILKNDSTITSKSASFLIDVAIVENGDGISEIKIYNNGKLIDSESTEKDLVFRGTKEYAKTFEVELIDGINNLKAIATSKKKIESDPITLQVMFDGEAAKTDLYIFSIGINSYKNSNYNLSYAVKDAQDFSKAVSKGGTTLFNKVHTYSLEDSKATKAEIESMFKELIEKVGPEDVFVFYYAGHGVMSSASEATQSDFYIMAHNVTSFFGESILKQEGVSATELLDFSRQISAQKQLFVLDACHSGGALNVLASRGADSREKAIAQLARNTGTFFLTASQDVEYANESGDLKHGLFTYALLEVLEGDVKWLTGNGQDNKITVNEMKTYVEERVPELSEKYHGSAQYPTSFSFGQDFPIV
ncbi:MAG: caspase family protein, partial [Crocinitomicaceae bacterium]